MKTTIADYDSKIREMAETHTIKEIADEIGYSVSYLATYQDENNIKAQRAPNIPDQIQTQQEERDNLAKNDEENEDEENEQNEQDNTEEQQKQLEQEANELRNQLGEYVG